MYVALCYKINNSTIQYVKESCFKLKKGVKQNLLNGHTLTIYENFNFIYEK